MTRSGVGVWRGGRAGSGAGEGFGLRDDALADGWVEAGEIGPRGFASEGDAVFDLLELEEAPGGELVEEAVGEGFFDEQGDGAVGIGFLLDGVLVVVHENEAAVEEEGPEDLEIAVNATVGVVDEGGDARGFDEGKDFAAVFEMEVAGVEADEAADTELAEGGEGVVEVGGVGAIGGAGAALEFFDDDEAAGSAGFFEGEGGGDAACSAGGSDFDGVEVRVAADLVVDALVNAPVEHAADVVADGFEAAAWEEQEKAGGERKRAGAWAGSVRMGRGHEEASRRQARGAGVATGKREFSAGMTGGGEARWRL